MRYIAIRTCVIGGRRLLQKGGGTQGAIFNVHGRTRAPNHLSMREQ